MKYLYFTLIALTSFLLLHTPTAVHAQDMRYQAHMDLTDPFQQEALRLIPVMESRIGRTLPMSVVLWHSSLRLSETLETDRRALERIAAAWTVPAFVSSVDQIWERDGNNRPNTACLIQLSTAGMLSTGALRTSYLAHEIFHCFQLALIGIDAVVSSPRWLFEGSAEFAGEYFSGGTIHAEPYWGEYLYASTPIRSFDYPGIGIFATIRSIGAQDPFELIDQLFTSADLARSWEKLGLLLSSIEKSQVASKTKRKNWANEYQLDFPGIPAVPALRATNMGTIATPTTLNLVSSQNYELQYEIPENKIIAISLASGAFGRVRVPALGGEDLEPVLEKPLNDGGVLKICRGTQCGCSDPTGEPIDVQVLPITASQIHLYLNSFTDATGTLKFEEAEANCCHGSRAMDPRLAGTWKLELQPMIDALKPRPDALASNIRGEHTAVISLNGTIRRSGYVAVKFEWTERQGRDRVTHFTSMNSSAAACLETRSTGENKGWMFHRGLSESSNYLILGTRNGRRTAAQDKNEEHPMIRWGMGTTGENTIYEIYGNVLKIRGEPRTYRRER